MKRGLCLFCLFSATLLGDHHHNNGNDGGDRNAYENNLYDRRENAREEKRIQSRTSCHTHAHFVDEEMTTYFDEP